MIVKKSEKAKTAVRTEFQTYASFSSENVVDMTERRLMKLAISLKDPVKKLSANTLLSDYRAGKIAIAWQEGQPLFTRITKA